MLLMLMTVTVYTPNIIYFSQREFFDHSFLSLVSMPFMMGMVVITVAAILFRLLPRLVLQVITALLLLLSLLMWLQTDYFAMSYGSLDGAALDFKHFDSRGMTEVLVLSVVSLVAILFSRLVVKNILFIVVIVLLGQVAMVTFNVIQEPEVKKKKVVDKEFNYYSSEKNVVLIVLDTFGAEYFQRLLKMNPKIADNYPGFVSYTDAISNYPATRGSMTSLLTAKMLPENVKFKEYKRAELSQNSLPKWFNSKNYAVSVVSNSNWLNDSFRKRFMSKIIIDEDTLIRYQSSRLFDYSLFRTMLHYIKPTIFNEGRWLFSEQVANQAQIPNTPTEKGRMLLDYMIEGASVLDNKPRFKMIHLTMPHPEYVYDKHCEKNSEIESWPVERRMLEQSECALNRLNLLLQKFKTLGIYDNSLIAVVSDHGSRIMNQHDITGFPSQFEMNSSGILMMIKGVGQTKPFFQVHQPYSLLNLGPVLIDESTHESDFSELRDDNRLFYAYQNWQASAKGALPDAPLYRVLPNYQDRNSWQLLDFGVNQCAGQTLPLNMTFENAGREGYCGVFGLARPHANGGGTWTASDDTRIIFNLDQSVLQGSENLQLKLTYKPMLFVGQNKLDLNLSINDQLIGSHEITKNEQQELVFEFQSSVLMTEKNVLKIELPGVRSQRSAMAGYDPKKLGLFLKAIDIY